MIKNILYAIGFFYGIFIASVSFAIQEQQADAQFSNAQPLSPQELAAPPLPVYPQEKPIFTRIGELAERSADWIVKTAEDIQTPAAKAAPQPIQIVAVPVLPQQPSENTAPDTQMEFAPVAYFSRMMGGQ